MVGDDAVFKNFDTGRGNDNFTFGDWATVQDFDSKEGDDSVAFGDDLDTNNVKTGALDLHHVVRANGCFSESLYLGPMELRSLSLSDQAVLEALFGPMPTAGRALNGPAARPFLTLRAARQRLAVYLKHSNGAATSGAAKWNPDLSMSAYEAKRLRAHPSGAATHGQPR